MPFALLTDCGGGSGRAASIACRVCRRTQAHAGGGRPASENKFRGMKEGAGEMRHGKKIMAAAALTALVVAGASQARRRDHAPLGVVPSLDLKRYAGRWYEIARLPNRFERDCASDTAATYTPRADGTLTVVNECRRADGQMKSAEGVARVVDRATNAKLEVRFAPAFLSFMPFVWGDYWVLALGDNYECALVGEPGREYLWVLSRTPQIDEGQYQELLKRAAAAGFDTSRMLRTGQGK
jgi:apolipoprotein D and lipocalin family protein